MYNLNVKMYYLIDAFLCIIMYAKNRHLIAQKHVKNKRYFIFIAERIPIHYSKIWAR